MMLKNIRKVWILLIVMVLGVVFSTAYFTNTHRYFVDGRIDDGYGGFGLNRSGNEFIVDGCGTGTMLDTVTGLCWLKDMNYFTTIQPWVNATTDCDTLDYAGHTDWRLPTRQELFTLIKEDGIGGATCTNLTSFGFLNCLNNYYWSSDSYYYDTSQAWAVHTGYGNDGPQDKTSSYYIICVSES